MSVQPQCALTSRIRINLAGWFCRVNAKIIHRTRACACLRRTARGIELELDISHELLGTILGMTPQMIAQDFLQLEREGIVDARGKHIVIHCRERLAKRV